MIDRACISLGEKCNLKCSYCHFHNEENGKLSGENNRIVSGSVLAGRTSEASICYLGRYHTQIAALEEGDFREFLGWQGPGLDKYSVKSVFAGKFLKKLFPMTTNKNGSPRAMVPIGMFEKVMPLDILPTAFLKASIAPCNSSLLIFSSALNQLPSALNNDL